MQTKSTRHDQDSDGAITSRAKITFVQFLYGRDFGEFENRAASLVFHEHLQAIPRRKGLRVQNSAIWRKPGDDDQGYHDGALETMRFKMGLIRTGIRMMRIRMRIFPLPLRVERSSD